MYFKMTTEEAAPLNALGINTNLFILAVFAVQMLILAFYVKRNSPKVLLWCVVVMSLVYVPARVLISTDYFNKKGYFSEYCGYIDNYLLNNDLAYNEGDFEWRTDFVAFYLNTTMLKNRPSVATFSSIQNTNVTPLLRTIGSTVGKNYVKVFKNAVSYDALMSVKEIVVYEDSLFRKKPSRKPCLTNPRAGNGYTIYDNKYYIPMGFTYDSYIAQSAIDSLMAGDEETDAPLQLLANLVVPDSIIPIAGNYMSQGVVDTGVSIDSIVGKRRENTCSTFAGDTRGFHATVTMPKANLLFFSVPCDKGFTGYVDGEKTDIYPVNLGLSAIKVEPGEHQIEFKYFPIGLREGLILSLIGLVITLMVLIFETRKR